MRKTKTATNIDAVKICCTEHKQLFNFLLEEDRKDFNNFYVEVGERVKDEEGQIMEIISVIYENSVALPLATLKISVNNPYCYLEMNNHALYKVVMLSDEEKISMLTLVPSIIMELGLKFHNITSVEVCIDMNVAALTRIKKAIKDVDGLCLYINGRRIAPDEAIPHHLRCYQATRLRLLSRPSLYFSNYNESLSLKCYDKGKELLEASNYKEDYIKEWDEINGQTLQRIELRITKDELRTYCSTHKMREEELLHNLVYDKTRRELLEYGINRLIYFNPMEISNKKKLKKLTLFDVAGISN